jgi:hypothetical protein
MWMKSPTAIAIHGGTNGSNPLSSSAESSANLLEPTRMLGAFSLKISVTRALSLPQKEIWCVQIETSRPISTTASTGSLKYSVGWAELR